MTQEALKLALEALDDLLYWDNGKPEYDEARKALQVGKQALAQTQEPVPPPWWPAVENILNEYGLQAIDFVADFKQALAQKREPIAMLFGSLPVYDDTTPPQRTWVDLTDEEITALLMPFPKYPSEWDDPDFYRLTQAIEAKLKEKNT
jgi:hypothetical protein